MPTKKKFIPKKIERTKVTIEENDELLGIKGRE
jgi:hypothetical protein